MSDDATSRYVQDSKQAAQLAVQNIDPTTYTMSGVATQGMGRPDGGHFTVPLISPVFEDELWQGGCISGVRLPSDFKHVISLYPWERYLIPEGCSRQEFKLYDGPVEDPSDYFNIAGVINECRRDGKTLVHCQAGLNRSALVTALALTLKGYAPQEAIDLLRERRSPMVLCNTEFEAWLLDNAAAA